MSNKQKILDYYYNAKNKQSDIAMKLQVSRAYVSKVIKNDDRYEAEKNKRIKENRKNNKEKTKEYMKKKREEMKNLESIVRHQHIQAIKELSENHGISNKAYRDWNKSVYRYNKKTSSYVLDKNINVGFAVPKTILWK